MTKFVLAFFILLFLPIMYVESFGFFGGDMVDDTSLPFNYDSIEMTSDIIQVKELDQAENLKRYIVFGHGSASDIF